MKICVLTSPEAGGARPRAFLLAGRRVPVAAILDRWEDPAGRYFRVRDFEGRRFVLRQAADLASWELAGVCAAPRRRAAA